ncbi:MAG: hypothetical protein HYU36_21335 [Planctomycetes bacterium]|nr:hypothetical protein [Planctomycetota bacterium]
MGRQPSQHRVLEFSGTPRACGRAYGECQAEAVRAFMAQEVPPDGKRLRYAGLCWEKLQRWERPVAEWTRGMAQGSGLAVEEITLLLLHEEIVHTKPCTGFGAAGAATRDGGAIIGQNWDWGPSLYPWSMLVRARTDSAPATLTYAYPGLWASAGMNEHGLSLVWTGSGYSPKVRPVVGIPTYALIAGILACRSCRDAIALMEQSPISGCFIFFLADAHGEVWVVEGLPRRILAVPCRDVLSRANHYECPESCAESRQSLPPARVWHNTRSRALRAAELLQKFHGRIDGHAAQCILRDHEPRLGLSICQHPVPGRPAFTIDSFYAFPARKELWIARGLPCRHDYARHGL